MSRLDLSQFKFDGVEITALREMLRDVVFQAPPYTGSHTLFSDVRSKKEIGWIGSGGLVGKAAQGCDPTPDEYVVSTRRMEWSPKSWSIPLRFCADDIEPLLARMSFNTGNDEQDLTNTEYLAAITGVLEEDMQKMIWRFIWFADTAAANVADSGVITNGTDVAYFNLLDGLWKQIFAAALGTRKHITIAANTAATEAAQLDGLTGDMAIQTLQKMWSRTGTPWRTQPDRMGMCTQSFADGYSLWFQGKEQESQIRRTVDGVDLIRYNGVDIQVCPVWDEIISAYQNNGTKLNNPHRVIFTLKSVLGVGTPDKEAIDGLQVFYDPVGEHTWVKSRGALDALLLNPEMVVLGM